MGSQSCRPKRTWWILLVILGCISVAALVVLMLLRVTLDDRGSALVDFALALVRNDTAAAKSIVVPGQWERINAWASDHEPFLESGISWDPDDNEMFWGCESCYYEGSSASCCDFNYAYLHDGGMYQISISDVVLQEIDGNYRVVSWGRVCESGRGDQDITCE